MKLERIATQRKYQHWPSWDLVYEWEDILCKKLDLRMYYSFRYHQSRKVLCIPYIDRLLYPRENTFVFEMNPMGLVNGKRCFNRPNIIPCIIDFFLEDKEIKRFVACYSNNPIVCVSSMEVFDFVMSSPSVASVLNLRHLPLSISDKYAIHKDTVFEKKFDMVLVGRQNPVLEKFVKTYADKHPDFSYVYRVLRNGQFNYYSNYGEFIGNINTRAEYMDLLRKGRCGLYSTPGIDGGEARTKGFNQVTPRFLELIAAGCHVAARYKSNPDTKYYELDSFSPSIDDYAQFEQIVDRARNTKVDMEYYSDYLKKHYTSVRAEQLKKLTSEL